MDHEASRALVALPPTYGHHVPDLLSAAFGGTSACYGMPLIASITRAPWVPAPGAPLLASGRVACKRQPETARLVLGEAALILARNAHLARGLGTPRVTKTHGARAARHGNRAQAAHSLSAKAHRHSKPLRLGMTHLCPECKAHFDSVALLARHQAMGDRRCPARNPAYALCALCVHSVPRGALTAHMAQCKRRFDVQEARLALTNHCMEAVLEGWTYWPDPADKRWQELAYRRAVRTQSAAGQSQLTDLFQSGRARLRLETLAEFLGAQVDRSDPELESEFEDEEKRERTDSGQTAAVLAATADGDVPWLRSLLRVAATFELPSFLNRLPDGPRPVNVVWSLGDHPQWAKCIFVATLPEEPVSSPGAEVLGVESPGVARAAETSRGDHERRCALLAEVLAEVRLVALGLKHRPGSDNFPHQCDEPSCPHCSPASLLPESVFLVPETSYTPETLGSSGHASRSGEDPEAQCRWTVGLDNLNHWLATSPLVSKAWDDEEETAAL